MEAKKNILVYGLSAVLTLSLISTAYFVSKNGSLKSDKNHLLLKNDSLTSIKWNLSYKNDSLIAEMNKMKANHDSEITFMNAEMENKIKTFNYNNSSITYYKNLYNELKTDYDKIKKQFDQLFADNNSLKEAKLLVEKNYNDLNIKNSFLTARIDSSKNIRCFNFDIANQNKSFKSTSKARKTKSSKINFLVAGNVFAESGSKIASILVYDPQGNVFSLPQNTFTLKSSKKNIAYTLSKTFEYNGKDVNLNTEVKYSKKLKKGNYKVEIYIDGILSGASLFVLK